MNTFNMLLNKTGGATAEAIVNSHNSPPSIAIRSAFFKPYASTSDFFMRATSVITAPISLSILFLELAFFGIAFPLVGAAVSIYTTHQGIPEQIDWPAVKAMSGKLLLIALASILTAFISPLLNLIDLIIGGCLSVAQAGRNEEKDTTFVFN